MDIWRWLFVSEIGLLIISHTCNVEKKNWNVELENMSNHVAKSTNEEIIFFVINKIKFELTAKNR